ncbi:MAG: FAD-dependent oxidoreductase [Candidatus Nanopelagicales bacterium]|jgi:NADPH-dependent 2,4-dienoyl-CoA reductase/sulfur reductase-like enzyme/rhodanese-related sulfurtransferase|nr:FAD-dependent oxidoreductase [Candidatus Nanopelagicales bacterium]
MKTIIVGGVAGGASAATRLRRLDESHEIVVLERSGYVSFANCGLPYYIGGTIADRRNLLLQTPRSLNARFGLDVRVNSEVISIDPAARTVTVRDLVEDREYTEGYDHLVLSPGASPIVPPIPGVERALTLRTIEDTDRIKERVDELLLAVDSSEEAVGGAALSVVVVGGGFIGLEMAESLRDRGMDVTVVELGTQVMAPLDPEMAAIVAAELRRHGVHLALGVQVTEVRPDTVLLSDGREVDADMVIMSIGVRPDTKLAVAAGLELGPRGGIKVDDQMHTSDPHIYAVGDAVDKSDATTGEPTLVPLANSANRQGRLVADAISGRTIRFGGVLGTAIVKVFDLTVALTGANEKRLKASGRQYAAIHTHPGSHAGYYPGAERISLKLIFDPRTGQVLGAQGVGGTGTDKRIDVLATAITGGITADELAALELAYAPPYGSAKDPINQLGYVAENIMAGTTRTIGWDQIDATDRFVLDVRTPGEFRRGHIAGAVNISVDDLRTRHTEIPRGASGQPVPVAVYCQVGQRGHTAARLLTQLGYDVVNLDGGWLTHSLARTS